MSHANAALTPAHRLRIGRLVVEEGWSVAAAADYFRVSWPTAKRWSDRYWDLLAGGTFLDDRGINNRNSAITATVFGRNNRHAIVLWNGSAKAAYGRRPRNWLPADTVID